MGTRYEFGMIPLARSCTHTNRFVCAVCVWYLDAEHSTFFT